MVQRGFVAGVVPNHNFVVDRRSARGAGAALVAVASAGRAGAHDAAEAFVVGYWTA